MWDPWGRNQPPADVEIGELPERLVRLAQVQATGVPLTRVDPYAEGFPQPEELPEVQALMRDGWRPLSSAPLHCLLPAAWPPEHRTWVPDRLPTVWISGTTGEYEGRIVAPDDRLGDDGPEELAKAAAHDAGLPDPPGGRIWLVRSPWPLIPVEVVYSIVWSVVDPANPEDQIGEFYRAATEVLTWDEERALRECPPDIRALLDAWAANGRTGEEASAVVEFRLTPTTLSDAQNRTGLDEATLLAWLSALHGMYDDATLEAIRRWNELGLPGNPPPEPRRFMQRNLEELNAFVDAGFDLYAADRLEYAGLEKAIAWREAGFDEADTYELLRSDPELTVQEARAFDDVDLDGDRRRPRRQEWIYYGFPAAEAAAWSAAGLTPYQARIWRAHAWQPSDVRPGQWLPPQLMGEHGYGGAFVRFGDGERTNSAWDEIPDPPGTRGRNARRRRGDPDPWINSD